MERFLVITNTGPDGTGKRVRISGYELWKIDNGAGGSRATWTGKPERVGEQGDESINEQNRKATLIAPSTNVSSSTA